MISVQESVHDAKPENAAAHSVDRPGFKAAVLILSTFILGAILSQFAYEWSQSREMQWIGILFSIVLGAGLLFSLYRPIMVVLDKPPFAISTLLFIAVGTAFGTFFAQNAPWETMLARYGETSSKVLSFLQLTDVFHSWWYIVLFLLMSASLVKISLKRSFSWQNLGFHLAHLSPIIILFGFWLDYYTGYRGMIHLEIGKQTNQVQLYQGNTNYAGGQTQLGFSVFLDTFEFENFDPDYRVQVWEKDGAVQKQRMMDGSIVERPAPRLIHTFPLREGKTIKLHDKDVQFQLTEFYPDFFFRYQYPEVTDTIPPNDPGIILDLMTPLGETELTLKSASEGMSKVNNPHMGPALEFFWVLPDSLSGPFRQGIIPEGYQDRHWVLFEGSTEQFVELFNGQLNVHPIQKRSFQTYLGQDTLGFLVKHIYPDSKFLEAVPASKSEALKKPVARLQVTSDHWNHYSEAFIYPSKSQGMGYYEIPDTKYILALGSMKDKQTKYWKSTITILDNGEETVLEQPIKVNEPLLYKGYRLYQTDYDPDNPAYSGIGITYTPGLYILYFGFYLLVAGVFIMFYWRPKNQVIS